MADLNSPDQRRGTARWRWFVAATIASLLLSLVPVTARVTLAASINVNSVADNVADDGVCTLREAITSANTDAVSGLTPGECIAGSGDDIINVPAGTYALTTASGGGDLDISTNVQIIGTGMGTDAGATIIDGSALGDRVFDVTAAATVSFSDLTIRGGKTGSDGAGIRTANAAIALSLADVLVTGNTAGGNGGGIYHNSSLSLVITDSIISDNIASGSGGGLRTNTRGTSTLAITNALFSGNSAGASGGGVSNNSGAATITGSTFANNIAAALLIAGVSGGGIYTQGNTLNLTSSTVSGNTMPGGTVGAAITAQRGVVTITSSTIADNTTGILAGITIGSPPGSTITIRNSIISGSTPGSNCATQTVGSNIGTIVDGDYNIDNGQSCFGPTPATTSRSNTDPQLQPLANNQPGLTPTHALVPGSPAVDPASADPACPATDQRGVSRPQPAAGSCDTGAYELLPAPAITTIDPINGPTAGGTMLTITGTGFQSNATVTVGGNPCTSPVVSGGTPVNGETVDDTQITCTTSVGPAGPADVVVTNPDGQATTLAGGFEYLTTQGAQPSPASLTFAAQQVNTTSATQPVKLTNTGTTPLAITAVAITGANPSDFAIDTNDCPAILAASAFCTVEVSFTPTATGARGAALTFTDDSGGVAGSQQNVSLSGTGIAPTVAFNPTSVAFGNQQVGTTSAAKVVTLTNNGTAPLLITNVALAGTNAGDFVLNNVNCTGTIAVSASCTMGVQFKPTADNLRVANIAVTDNANSVPGSVQNVPLSGGALPAFTVNATANAGGTINPSGPTNYSAGAEASYTATANTGQVFLGWTLDGVYVGYASPLKFTVNGNRTLAAQFAARPSFGDVPTGDADYQAITFLAAMGIVNPAGVNGSGNFEPNRDVKRAEMAAFVARVFGWDTQFHSNTFPDQCDPNGVNCVDNELWNNVAALQDYGVVEEDTDSATCTASGTTAPCYLPRDPVLRVQVVSIVARAFIKDPTLRPDAFWTRLAADLAQYTNVSNEGTQRSDLTTYRANAGPIPGQASDTTFPNPGGNGSRRFVIEVLYLAFNAWFSVDRVP